MDLRLDVGRLVHSHAADSAAAAFLFRDKHLILDLACDVGKDARYLQGRGLTVVGNGPDYRI